MNPETIAELIQKSFRVTLGAAASAVDAVQNPQQSSEKFSDIGTDFERLADELEVKGALTEKEARDFVNGIMSQMPEPFRSASSPFNNGDSPSRTTVDTTATPAINPSVQAELETLTEELTAVRAEIEQLSQPD
ncbi:hypothetical protein IQ241_14140 [Romeria aff. gracilis LEGE 07310]|uniref:Uncharacterized protein n=1 Tax=Vasconcelosia minhoensis LEGE 07310 TaxID=915328 RepID=A0A8J7AQA5_9CYAN|nr:hypothetical protein [Romeria gracilis]MBE9078421.1 hypothetical protein [Romeria aff. gracilis LEGE 07310]